MQEEVIAKVVEWIQTMGRGEKIVIHDKDILFSIKRQRTKLILFCEHRLWKQKTFLTVNELLHFAQQQVKKDQPK